MRTKKIFAIAATLAAMLGLAACHDSENVYNDEEREAYDTAFTLRFGSVSSRQEWNACRRCSVYVQTHETIDTLKVYVRSNNGYRLSAVRIGVTGKAMVDFDAPKGHDDIVIKAGDYYNAEIGEYVNTHSLTGEPSRSDVSDQPVTWTIAVEAWDVLTDFDFNDVVIGVTHVDGEPVARLYPLAIGSELHTWVTFGDFTSDEWHRYYGSNFLHLQNTYTSPESFPEPIVLDVPADWSLAFREGESNMGNIGVTFRRGYDNPGGDTGFKYQDAVPPLRRGMVPHMILAGADWWWPRESTAVDEAYPASFRSWLKGETANNSLWHEHTNASIGNVISYDTEILN